MHESVSQMGGKRKEEEGGRRSQGFDLPCANTKKEPPMKGGLFCGAVYESVEHCKPRVCNYLVIISFRQ